MISEKIVSVGIEGNIWNNFYNFFLKRNYEIMNRHFSANI